MVKEILLKSSRLLLRKLLEEDCKRFLELQKNNIDLDWIKFKREHDYIFSIILKNSNSFVGICALEIIEDESQAKLFYALLSNFCGNGYGLEAIKELINFAFLELSLNKISAHFNNTDTNAWKVAERAGLKYMGQDQVNNKNIMVFSINKKEFLNQKWY